jgi:hypothetical protein
MVLDQTKQQQLHKRQIIISNLHIFSIMLNSKGLFSAVVAAYGMNHNYQWEQGDALCGKIQRRTWYAGV